MPYQFGLASGGCIVLVALFFFALFYIVKRVQTLFKQHHVLKEFE
jgi:ABC-type Mn2+/Zn2+ transport system permease subunit